jgi:hypothetical protein
MNDSYPDNWPCECGHPKSEHGPQGVQKMMCKLKDPKPKRVSSQVQWLDDCVEFEPVDNLTYVEHLAGTKGVK